MPPLQVSATVHALQHSKYLLFYLAEEIRKRLEAISSEEQKALEKLAEKVKHGKK